MIFVTFLCLLVYFLGVGIFLYYTFTFIVFKGWKNPPYFPSMGHIKKELLNEVERYLKTSQELHIGDLGCGDGRLIKPLAKKFPQHQFYGYEWDNVPFQIAKFSLRKNKNVHLIKGDFFHQDLKHLNIIVCYLSPNVSGETLKKQLNTNTFVFSAVFPIKEWHAKKVIQSNLYGLKTKIFIYQV